MSDEVSDIEPIECTEDEVADVGYMLAMEHMEKAFKHLEKFAQYRNFRLQFERRHGDHNWARITIIPEPDPEAQVPCGFCGGSGAIDGRDCLVCEGRGTVHKGQECIVDGREESGR